MYTVIHMFRDKADGGRIYCPGDDYPRAGIEVSAERLMQLSTCDNARGKPLIVKVDEHCEACEIAPEAPARKPTRKRVKKDND